MRFLTIVGLSDSTMVRQELWFYLADPYFNLRPHSSRCVLQLSEYEAQDCINWLYALL